MWGVRVERQAPRAETEEEEFIDTIFGGEPLYISTWMRWLSHEQRTLAQLYEPAAIPTVTCCRGTVNPASPASETAGFALFYQL